MTKPVRTELRVAEWDGQGQAQRRPVIVCEIDLDCEIHSIVIAETSRS
jgi:hypothetical protein